MNVEQNPSPALPCAVVRDLLPLYLEGLTSPQTDQAVETHLELCPNCAQYKAALTAPLSSPEPTADQREPDYLKTIRRRGLRRTVLTAFGVVLAMLLLFAPNCSISEAPPKRKSCSGGRNSKKRIV